MHNRVLNWPRSLKRLVVICADVIFALLATWGAYSLREEVLHWPQGWQWLVYLSGPLIAIPIFIRFGLYRAIFRYTGLDALVATGQAVALYALLHLIVLFWYLWPTFPLTLGVLQPILFLLLVSLSRAAARFWLAGVGFGSGREKGRMLIYGAGTVGVQTSSAMSFAEDLKLLGFIDDDAAKIGQTINGVPVFSPAEVPALVAKLGITDILLAIPSVSRERRNKIIHDLRPLHVHTRTLPGLSDLASGRVTVGDFRELDIEDLLGREAVRPQTELFASRLLNRTVLVTAARSCSKTRVNCCCLSTANLACTPCTANCWPGARPMTPALCWCPCWPVW